MLLVNSVLLLLAAVFFQSLINNHHIETFWLVIRMFLNPIHHFDAKVCLKGVRCPSSRIQARSDELARRKMSIAYSDSLIRAVLTDVEKTLHKLKIWKQETRAFLNLECQCHHWLYSLLVSSTIYLMCVFSTLMCFWRAHNFLLAKNLNVKIIYRPLKREVQVKAVP